MTYKGSCLGGRIRYEIAGPPEYIGNCHCANCRKSHGAAFASFARVLKSCFRFVSGEESVSRYRSSERVTRHFCGICGANLFSEVTSQPESMHLRVGTLDDDPGVRPSFHVFVGSKAPWFEITDGLPQSRGFPADRGRC